MNTILRFIYIPILLLGLFNAWQLFDKHKEEMLMLEQDQQTQTLILNKSKKKLGEIAQFKDNLAVKRREYQSLQADLAELQRKLPTESKSSDVILYFTTLAENVNLPQRRISPGNTLNQKDYRVEQYNFNGEGTYLQLLIFLESLAQSERIYDLARFSITSLKKGENSRYNYLQFNAVIQTYLYNKGSEVQGEPK